MLPEETCAPHHDWFTAVLTFGLCGGLVISYVPQHLRIIQKGSSEGFSPFFLLLGSTSSAAGMLNMVAMQWSIVRCCQFFSLSSCLEMTAGVIQVGLQWAMFTFIFMLYMIYYPPHMKYKEIEFDNHDNRPPRHIKLPAKSADWRLSIFLSWVTATHLFIIIFTTFFLIISNQSTERWATFLGVSSAILAAIQYAPQIIHTYNTQLVGALSIPMMLIQSPGAVLMVLSVALRPGTNWTSWITFAVAGTMQGTLLIMCIAWKIRQQRLGIDDFGNLTFIDVAAAGYDDEVPGLVITDEDPDPIAVRVALANALESAVGNDVRCHGLQRVDSLPLPVEETTPLLKKGKSPERTSTGWFGWGWGNKDGES